MGALETPQLGIEPEMPEHVTGIAAVGRGGVIGVRGDVPWRIPDDWRRFKQVTMGGALIMGRLTFESIGKPLPGRLSIVISRNAGRGSYEYGDGSSGPSTDATMQENQARGTVPLPPHQKTQLASQVIHVHSIQDALAAAKRSELNTFVAGGAQVYRLAWPYLTDLDITEVDQEPGGDAFFPPIEESEWAEVSREPHDGFAFVHYVRRARR